MDNNHVSFCRDFEIFPLVVSWNRGVINRCLSALIGQCISCGCEPAAGALWLAVR